MAPRHLPLWGGHLSAHRSDHRRDTSAAFLFRRPICRQFAAPNRATQEDPPGLHCDGVCRGTGAAQRRALPSSCPAAAFLSALVTVGPHGAVGSGRSEPGAASQSARLSRRGRVRSSLPFSRLAVKEHVEKSFIRLLFNEFARSSKSQVFPIFKSIFYFASFPEGFQVASTL